MKEKVELRGRKKQNNARNFKYFASTCQNTVQSKNSAGSS